MDPWSSISDVAAIARYTRIHGDYVRPSELSEALPRSASELVGYRFWFVGDHEPVDAGVAGMKLGVGWAERVTWSDFASHGRADMDLAVAKGVLAAMVPTSAALERAIDNVVLGGIGGVSGLTILERVRLRFPGASLAAIVEATHRLRASGRLRGVVSDAGQIATYARGDAAEVPGGVGVVFFCGARRWFGNRPERCLGEGVGVIERDIWTAGRAVVVCPLCGRPLLQRDGRFTSTEPAPYDELRLLASKRVPDPGDAEQMRAARVRLYGPSSEVEAAI